MSGWIIYGHILLPAVIKILGQAQHPGNWESVIIARDWVGCMKYLFPIPDSWWHEGFCKSKERNIFLDGNAMQERKCLDLIVLIILWHSTVSVIALFDLSLWFNGELVGIVKWICLRKIKVLLFAFFMLVLLIVLVAFPRQMIHQLLVTCVAAKHTLTQSYKNHQVLIANMQYLESKAKHTKIIPQVSLRHNKKERWIFEELQRIDSDESRLPFHNCVKLVHFVFPLFKLKPTSSTNER